MIGTVMKFVTAAALMGAPATVEASVGVVSWNAGGNDAPGNYDHFFGNQTVKNSNIVLLQESKDHKLGIAHKAGWHTQRMQKAITTAWDPTMFTPIKNARDCDELIGGNGGRPGTVCTMALESKKGIVMVVNVHAGHNGWPSNVHHKSAATALQQLRNHQKKFIGKYLKGKKAGLIIVGGDHNELGLHIGGAKKSPLIGDTKFVHKVGPTHNNGAIDLMFASRGGKAYMLHNFRSDHWAIAATIF